MSETKPAKLSTVEEVSAGGVVFRETNSGYEAAITAAKSNGRWQLPKGLIDADETPETAALREVREEAGIDADLIRKIDVIEYWYVGDHKGERARIHKFVHFFLMKYVSGDVKDHDDEVVEARWVKIEEALEMLAFEGERSIVEQASRLVKN